MDKIRFSDIKEKLEQAINSKLSSGAISGEGQGLTLIEGFFTQPMQNELSGSFIIGGPAVPMIAVVGNSTGRMYFFALKALLPELKI